MASTLHLDGLPEEAVTLGLVALREKIKLAEKKVGELRRSTDDLDELDAAAKDLLDQLGYKEPEKKKRPSVAEVVRTDPKQQSLPLETKPSPRSRVSCTECRCRMAVPVGETRRKCPDCGAIQLVVSDEDGTVFRQRRLLEPPDDMRALMLREKSEDLAPLTKAEEKLLKAWRKENPDHTTDGELIPAGDRIADPERPGSGNPLEVVCDSYIGNSCSGFTTTDTPGESVCPKCGQKWTVRLEKKEPNDPGRILVTPYDPKADDPPTT